jgi:hypothetical protein
MILRQPLPHVGRQQEPPLAIAHDEVLRHTQIVLNPPDSNTLARQLTWMPKSAIAP